MAAKKKVEDFDTSKAFEPFTVEVGGREFTISAIPPSVALEFIDAQYGSKRWGDAFLSATLAVLNHNAEPRVSKEWLLDPMTISARDLEGLIQTVLAPYLNKQ